MGKASAIAPVYDHIAKDKLDQLRADCDDAAEWIAEREKKLADHKKWEDPVFSIVELNVRTSSLMTSCQKILSEPRPKPKKEEKEKEKGPKKTKAKNNADSKDPKTDKDVDGEDETENDSPSDAKKEKKTSRLLLRFLLPLVVLIPVAAIFAGYGESYGVPSPWPTMQSYWPFGATNQEEDGGFDDVLDAAESGELAGVESADADELVEPEIVAETVEASGSEDAKLTDEA